MKTMICCGLFLLLTLSGETINPILAADEQRRTYDKMVEETVREADEYMKQKKSEQNEATEQKEGQAHSAIDERAQAESERIKAEMQKIRERGLGPNFTEGMRENQLQELEDKLNRLESDPEAYFNQ